ncbi:MAG: rhamnose ABC transporter substrate-binding protein [Mycobacteriales bacterium]
MIRKAMAGVTILAMTVTLAACGDDKKKETPPAATSAAATTSAPAATSAAATTPPPVATSDAATTAPPAAAGLAIAVVPKALNNPYFDASNKGAQKACAEVKATKCDYVGPTEATGAAQLEFLNTLIQQKYDVIVMSAADKAAVAPAMKEAQAAGITVVTFDADVDDDSARSLMITPSDAEQIGRQQVKWALELAGPEGGEIAILSAAQTAENQNKWIEFMNDELKKPEYAKLKLVDTVYGDDDAAKSAEQAAGLMTAHPKLKVIISPTTVGIREAAKYISGSDFKGKVQVTGLGLPSEMKTYVLDDTSKVFGLWNPVDLGYIGVIAGAAIKNGELKPAKGATFKAGEFDLKVGDKNVVVVGPPFEFKKDNIEEFAAIY